MGGGEDLKWGGFVVRESNQGGAGDFRTKRYGTVSFYHFLPGCFNFMRLFVAVYVKCSK